MNNSGDSMTDSLLSGQSQDNKNRRDRFRHAVEQHDLTALLEALAPNVVFHSPIVHQAYEGREAVAPLLAAVLKTFTDFVYVDEFNAPDGKVLLFRTRVREREVEGVDILKFDTEGLVQEFTVMVRPYSAATALREAMAALLASTQGEKPAR